MSLKIDLDNTQYFSVYVHIPFCSHRCDYCDFATWADKEYLIEKYIDTVINQWNFHVQKQNDITDKKLRSIFFGGGTPNLIDPKYIVKIINGIKTKCGSISQDCEITVEANPDQISLKQMQTYFDGGVNRISVGVQSTNQAVLDYLGRRHKANKIKQAIDNLTNSGITNYSCDLIYGSGNESLAVFEKSLLDIIALKPKHISAYSLGVEKGTPLYTSIAAGEKQNINEDDLADKYELADKILSENGYQWYEISNWSLPGFESKHNLSYWRGIDVIALGCAAHGFTNSNRIATPRDIERYISKLNSLDILKMKFDDLFTPILENENVSAGLENFALKLRTRKGVYWPEKKLNSHVKEMIDEGFCYYDSKSSTLNLTLNGRLLAHSISLSLFESYESLDLL